jgi:hypothetical protein
MRIATAARDDGTHSRGLLRRSRDDECGVLQPFMRSLMRSIAGCRRIMQRLPDSRDS